MPTATISSVEQLWKHPPAGRCELVRGELRMMSPAGSEHGWIVMNIAAPLATFVKQQQLGYVFGAETGFIIQRNPDTVRAPDVAFVRSERVQGELPKSFFDGPPDLAIEVLSPNDSASEVHEKAEDWLMSGCMEVWIVDPHRKVASRCTQTGSAITQQRVDRLSCEFLPGFEVQVEELFKR